MVIHEFLSKLTIETKGNSFQDFMVNPVLGALTQKYIVVDGKQTEWSNEIKAI